MVRKWLRRIHRNHEAAIDPHELLAEARAKEIAVAQVVADLKDIEKRNNFGRKWAAALKEAPR